MITRKNTIVRDSGIEPLPQTWKVRVLPLNQSRDFQMLPKNSLLGNFYNVGLKVV